MAATASSTAAAVYKGLLLWKRQACRTPFRRLHSDGGLDYGAKHSIAEQFVGGSDLAHGGSMAGGSMGLAREIRVQKHRALDRPNMGGSFTWAESGWKPALRKQISQGEKEEACG
ncbi:hypothetical protein SKAU_G00192480 [Synaphobranchus kaupii]|uniref:Uncharacterized protein n=1 Tax=Synaphobranchus kaupii TaxID=118154 RepID=A0A9Q1IWH6_SYNKA|nr:hypothetical protein SKAU_G00192480 [Synaphobranchus kaupii]